jgi:hypothetical protein
MFITDGVPSSSAKAHCTYSRRHLHPAGISITSPLSIHGHMGGKPCLVKLVMTSPFSLPPLIHLRPLPVSSSLHAADLLLIKDGNGCKISAYPRVGNRRGYGHHSPPAGAGAGTNLNPADSYSRAKKFAILTRIPARPAMTCGTRLSLCIYTHNLGFPLSLKPSIPRRPSLSSLPIPNPPDRPPPPGP